MLVVDARPKHLPVVLANAKARGCLAGESTADSLLDSSLFGLLAPASASAIPHLLAALTDREPVRSRELAWCVGDRQTTLLTELKLIAAAPGQRFIVLTFDPAMARAELASVFDQLPFDVLLLDRDLDIVYANAGALRSSGVAAGLLGCSALNVAPTKALPKDVYVRALAGCRYLEQAVETESASGLLSLVEMDVQPWRDASGIVGLIVLSNAVDRHDILNNLRRANEHRLRALTENARDRAFTRLGRGRESTDGQLDIELEMTTLKDRRIWVRLTGHLEKLGGRPFRACGSRQTIQGQKLSQIALENSSGSLKLSMNMADMHAWRWDKTKDELICALAGAQRSRLQSEACDLQQFLSRVL